jgi:HEAT repeat protein
MSSLISVESLGLILNRGNTQEKLAALQAIDAKLAIQLFDQISALTSDYRPEIRVAALQSLRFLDQSCLVNILRETLRDENKKVRCAASELFHQHDLAA